MEGEREITARHSPALASPREGSPLSLDGSRLVAASGGLAYSIVDGIYDLLDEELADDALAAELEVFEEALPFDGLAYFRDTLFSQAVELLGCCLNRDPRGFVEIGGGEGYLARAFKAACPEADSYVADLSMRHLKLAPTNLHRLRCDVRRPYLLPNSVDAAAFWVSLHHFNESDGNRAIEQAREILTPGGVLMVFEPCGDFLPRRLFLNTPLKKLVYFDEAEKALSYSEVKDMMGRAGFEPVFRCGHNPPYNQEFLKCFRFGGLFRAATEILYLSERLAKLGRQPWWRHDSMEPAGKSMPPCLGGYLLSIFRKPM